MDSELQAAFASKLLKEREAAVSKLEDILSQASQMVSAVDKKVLTLGRQKQKDIAGLHRVQEMCQYLQQRMKEEIQQIQVQKQTSSLIPISSLPSVSSIVNGRRAPSNKIRAQISHEAFLWRYKCSLTPLLEASNRFQNLSAFLSRPNF